MQQYEFQIITTLWFMIMTLVWCTIQFLLINSKYLQIITTLGFMIMTLIYNIIYNSIALINSK